MPLDFDALLDALDARPEPTAADALSLLATKVARAGMPVCPLHRETFRPVAAKDILGVRELDHFDKQARHAARHSAAASATIHHREGAAMATLDPAWTAAPISRAADKFGFENVCLGGALTGEGLAVAVVPPGGSLPETMPTLWSNPAYHWLSLPEGFVVHDAVPEIVIGSGETAVRVLLRDRIVPLPPCGAFWGGWESCPPASTPLLDVIESAGTMARREALQAHPTWVKGKRVYI